MTNELNTLPKVLRDKLLKRSKIIEECLVWTGPNRSALRSYGVIWWEEKTQNVHSVVGNYLYGNDKMICHINECKHKNCFRPSHLYKGSAKDNVKDSIDKGIHHFPIGLGRKSK